MMVQINKHISSSLLHMTRSLCWSTSIGVGIVVSCQGVDHYRVHVMGVSQGQDNNDDNDHC